MGEGVPRRTQRPRVRPGEGWARSGCTLPLRHYENLWCPNDPRGEGIGECEGDAGPLAQSERRLQFFSERGWAFRDRVSGVFLTVAG